MNNLLISVCDDIRINDSSCISDINTNINIYQFNVLFTPGSLQHIHFYFKADQTKEAIQDTML